VTAYVLLIGTLHRDPALRMAKSGKPFAAALVRAESGGGTIWADIAVFMKSRRPNCCGSKQVRPSQSKAR
jgi:hypothetical protein